MGLRQELGALIDESIRDTMVAKRVRAGGKASDVPEQAMEAFQTIMVEVLQKALFQLADAVDQLEGRVRKLEDG